VKVTPQWFDMIIIAKRVEVLASNIVVALVTDKRRGSDLGIVQLFA